MGDGEQLWLWRGEDRACDAPVGARALLRQTMVMTDDEPCMHVCSDKGDAACVADLLRCTDGGALVAAIDVVPILDGF